MAATYQVGDFVWAKLKGFSAWPGKVIEPKPEVKRPKDKKPYEFIFFFGSENYAWIPHDMIWEYPGDKSKFIPTKRVPQGFQKACDKCEEAFQLRPAPAPPSEESEGSVTSENKLPSIAEELAQINKNPVAKDAEIDTPNSQRLEDSPENDTVDESDGDKILVSNGDGAEAKAKRERKPSKKIQESLDSDDLPLIPKKKKEESEKEKRPRKRENSDTVATVKPKKQKMVVKTPGTPKKARDSDLVAAGDSTITMTSPIKPSRSVIATPLKIGFLGLGNIGQGVVTSLLRAGHEVTVWNRTASKCRDFMNIGALRGNSIAEVIEECDITFSCVSDPTAARDIVFGNCGVLQGISSGKGYVEMSTIDIETVVDINEAVLARGGRFLEAPVVGSRQPAMTGDLVVLAAGDRDLFDDCYSCFDAMGKKSFYLGEVGSGAKLKLVYNTVMGGMMAGLAEGLALAQKVGLDQDDVLRVLSLGDLNCDLFKSKGQAITEHDFTTNFPLQHLQKDLRLGIDMGDQVDQPLCVAAAANELFKRAKSMRYGESDISAVYRATDV